MPPVLRRALGKQQLTPLSKSPRGSLVPPSEERSMAGCRPLPEGHRGLQPPRARDEARPSDPAPPAAAPQQQALCDDWRLGQCRALGRATGAGAAQRAAADRILPSSRPGLPRGPPAVALGPEGRSGIVPPREKGFPPFCYYTSKAARYYSSKASFLATKTLTRRARY